MVSSLHSSLHFPSHISPYNRTLQHPNSKLSLKIFNTQIKCLSFSTKLSGTSAKLPLQLLQKSCVPLAVSLVIFWSNPAQAGFLSGLPGIESVPGPKLPTVDFLDRYVEGYQKKYAENDERFKSSPIIKELLERSKQNKEKNKQEIQDKYCLRGAEWGVGDCSTQGMTEDERDAFIAMLKKKAGVD